MKVFVGIKVDALRELPLIKHKLGSTHSKWVDHTNYHLTLLFIGETEPIDIEKISKALHKIAAHGSSFNFKIKGAGAFQNRKSNGVLWLGVEENAVLKNLQNEVSNSLLNVLPNLKNQYKDYTPHITVARIRDRGALNDFMLQLSKLKLNVQQNVSEIVLYESVSAEFGVEYRVMERFVLNKKGRSLKDRP